MALELGDQDLLFLCFLNLFSSGPLLREETDITKHTFCVRLGSLTFWRWMCKWMNKPFPSFPSLSQSALGVQFMSATSWTVWVPTWKCCGWCRSTHSLKGHLCRAGVNAWFEGMPQGGEIDAVPWSRSAAQSLTSCSHICSPHVLYRISFVAALCC